MPWETFFSTFIEHKTGTLLALVVIYAWHLFHENSVLKEKNDLQKERAIWAKETLEHYQKAEQPKVRKRLKKLSPLLKRRIVAKLAAVEKGDSQRRVLIVDDSDGLARVLKNWLEAKTSVSVTIVGNGEAALAAFGRGNFDGMLLDLMMPGISGFDVLHEVKKNSPMFPVVIMSGLPGTKVEFAKKAGVSPASFEYLAKPFNLGDLDVALRRLGVFG